LSEQLLPFELMESWSFRVEMMFPSDASLPESESVCHLLRVQGFEQMGIDEGLQFSAQSGVDAKGLTLVDGNLFQIAQGQNHMPDSAVDLKQSGVGKEFGVTVKIVFSHFRLLYRWIWLGMCQRSCAGMSRLFCRTEEGRMQGESAIPPNKNAVVSQLY